MTLPPSVFRFLPAFVPRLVSRAKLRLAKPRTRFARSGAVAGGLALLALAFWSWKASDLAGLLGCLPRSAVLLDQTDRLLDARLATDGQWRFPALTDTLPQRYQQAVVAFEDRRFRYHPGVDPLSLGAALASQLGSQGVRRGGSTLTMQVVRMARGNPPRTLWEKAREGLLALVATARYSKAEILRMYASEAPFGGNTVGLEAASWRYFGRPPETMSWGEACLLAVLPNQPSLLHVARNRDRLLAKRNRLIDALARSGALDSLEATLAKSEPLPPPPRTPPRLAGSLVHTLQAKDGSQRAFRSTLDLDVQRRLFEELAQLAPSLHSQGIANAAVVVLENRTGNVLAYGPNLPEADSMVQAGSMDLARSRRSSGSILKPFLYEMLFEQGELFPSTLVPDVPSSWGGFLPENFDRTWRGAIPASEALTLSLNAPAARLLAHAGVDRFRSRLVDLGMTTLQRDAGGYGLTLVLGGAETTVWDLAGMYGRLAADAQQLPPWRAPRCLREEPRQEPRIRLHPACAFWTLEILRDLNRPGDLRNWQSWEGARPVAWKTGTSNGHRDAWAVGTTPERTIAVWVGNADGTGMPDIVGRDAAAPLLFRLLGMFPADGWFQRPAHGWKMVDLCPTSGRPASPSCPRREAATVPDVPLLLTPCAWHQSILVDSRGRRVHEGCSKEAKARTVFALPPEEARGYQSRDASESGMPPWAEGCAPEDDGQLVVAYPAPGARIVLPRGQDEQRNPLVLRAAFTGNGRLHWHMDGTYLGQSAEDHQMPAHVAPGWHVVTVLDPQGRSATCRFQALAP